MKMVLISSFRFVWLKGLDSSKVVGTIRDDVINVMRYRVLGRKETNAKGFKVQKNDDKKSWLQDA